MSYYFIYFLYIITVKLVWLSCFIVRFLFVWLLLLLLLLLLFAFVWGGGGGGSLFILGCFLHGRPFSRRSTWLQLSWGDCVVHGTVDSKLQELTRITSIGFDPVYRWAPHVYLFIPVLRFEPCPFMPVYFMNPACPCHFTFWTLPVHASLRFEPCLSMPVYVLNPACPCQFTFWTLPVHASLRFELCPFMPVYFLSSACCCQFTFWVLPVVVSLLFDLYPFMPLYFWPLPVHATLFFG